MEETWRLSDEFLEVLDVLDLEFGGGDLSAEDMDAVVRLVECIGRCGSVEEFIEEVESE